MNAYSPDGKARPVGCPPHRGGRTPSEPGRAMRLIIQGVTSTPIQPPAQARRPTSLTARSWIRGWAGRAIRLPMDLLEGPLDAVGQGLLLGIDHRQELVLAAVTLRATPVGGEFGEGGAGRNRPHRVAIQRIIDLLADLALHPGGPVKAGPGVGWTHGAAHRRASRISASRSALSSMSSWAARIAAGADVTSMVLRISRSSELKCRTHQTFWTPAALTRQLP